MTTKTAINICSYTLIVFLLLGIAVLFCMHLGFIDRGVPVIVRSDTVIVRDTIRIPVPTPVAVTVVRHDTVRLPSIPPVAITTELPEASDTAAVIMPITRRTYSTDDYRAVVEGYAPRLVSMELYPRRTTITNTVARRPRWAIVVGPSVGVGPRGAQAYMGVTAGWSIVSR